MLLIDVTEWNEGTHAPLTGGMPRFYFHLHNDVDCPDHQGVELAGLEFAKMHALQNARHIAGQTVKDLGHIIGQHRIDVENGEGRVLDTVYFRDAVNIQA